MFLRKNILAGIIQRTKPNVNITGLWKLIIFVLILIIISDITPFYLYKFIFL